MASKLVPFMLFPGFPSVLLGENATILSGIWMWGPDAILGRTVRIFGPMRSWVGGETMTEGREGACWRCSEPGTSGLGGRDLTTAPTNSAFSAWLQPIVPQPISAVLAHFDPRKRKLPDLRLVAFQARVITARVIMACSNWPDYRARWKLH